MADDDAQQGQVQVRDPARETCSDEREGGQRRPATGIGFRLAAYAFHASLACSTDVSKKSPAARITRRAGGIISDTCEESGPGQRFVLVCCLFCLLSVLSRPSLLFAVPPSAAFLHAFCDPQVLENTYIMKPQEHEK